MDIMYNKIEGIESFIDSKGEQWKPIASIQCEVEGLVHICKDDNCYLVFTKQGGTEYKSAVYLCAEVIDFLYSLPKLQVRHWLIGNEPLTEDKEN